MPTFFNYRTLRLIAFASLIVAPLSSQAIPPCCSITSIQASGLVTATEKASGRQLQFQVTDPKLLRSLRIGQPIDADFAKQKV